MIVILMIELLKKNFPREGAPWVVWKYLFAFGTVAIVMGMYFPLSFLTEGRSYDLTTDIDRAVPFMPWTWWIYFPIYLVGILFAVGTFRDLDVYLRALICMILGQLIITVCYWFLPSTYPRPCYEWVDGSFVMQQEALCTAVSGTMKTVMIWFWNIDPPNNTFPSAHVALSAMTALAMWHERNRYRWVSILVAIGVFVTVHTTKQHYFADAVAGLLVAIFTYFLIFRWLPKTRIPRSSPN